MLSGFLGAGGWAGLAGWLADLACRLLLLPQRRRCPLLANPSHVVACLAGKTTLLRHVLQNSDLKASWSCSYLAWQLLC